MFLTSNLALSDEQRTYLDSLNLTTEEMMKIEKGEYDKFTDINRLVKILFACLKCEDAYQIMRNNLNNIDFKDIFQSKFIQLDREATDIYKYMYDNEIIDKQNYMYFEVLSGKLNDWDFWKKEFEGLTTTQILETINKSYNNLFVSQNINPYELGLVNLTEEQDEYVFSRIAKDEKVDCIFAETPCINANPQRILKLLINNNLDRELSGFYFKIVYNIYNSLYNIEDNKEVYNSLFDIIKEYTNDEYMFIDIIDGLGIDTINKLFSLIDYIKESYSSLDILKICINNPLMLNYSYTILDKLNINSNENRIDVSKYLYDRNMGFVVSYMLHEAFDTDTYIIKYPFPYGYPMVYNNKTEKILIGNDLKDANDDNIFGFIDDYIIAGSINDEIFKNFQSEEDYSEFILAADRFRVQVLNHIQTKQIINAALKEVEE